MRKRSLSVAYERTPKVEQISKKFEGVPSEHEHDSDSEEENEDLDTMDAAPNWTVADYKKLVEQLRSVLPRKDSRKYQSTLKKIDWERVAFDGHTPEEIKAVTCKMVTKVRKYRTLGEMVEDIPQQVEKLFSTGKPKHPPTAYNFFIKDKFSSYKTKYPDLKTHEQFKLICKDFASLSDKKKLKYETMAAQAKEAYKLQLEKYFKDNPEVSILKKSSKVPKEKKQTVKMPKTITPFALFKIEQKAENSHITMPELRNQWNELELKKKVKYIQQAFKSQTENSAKPLKLTKEEQRLLEQARGKPGTFASSTSEYYLKHHAEPDPLMTVAAWRKAKLLEYKRLSKVRRLELEIEYRQAKQEYVTKYEAYIEQIKDEQVRDAEIELLRSFIQTRMDKHDREQCDSRPLMSMLESSRLEPEIMDYPIAESTTLAPKSKKTKGKVGEKSVEPKTEPVAAVESPQKKPLKSILKSPAPVVAVPKSMVREFVAPNTVSTPTKKRKQSLSGHDSDSSSTEKKSKLSIITLSTNTETGKKKASSKENGNAKPLTDEPIRPPTNALQFFKQNYYLGKPENCAESFKKLSAARKASIKSELRAAHKKYFKQLQKFLKTVPQKNIEIYLKKLKQAELDSNKGEESSSEDEEEDAGKEATKQEPETSSSSSEDEEDAAPAKTQNGGENNDDDDDEDEDDSSSSDE